MIVITIEPGTTWASSCALCQLRVGLGNHPRIPRGQNKGVGAGGKKANLAGGTQHPSPFLADSHAAFPMTLVPFLSYRQGNQGRRRWVACPGSHRGRSFDPRQGDLSLGSTHFLPAHPASPALTPSSMWQILGRDSVFGKNTSLCMNVPAFNPDLVRVMSLSLCNWAAGKLTPNWRTGLANMLSPGHCEH